MFRNLSPQIVVESIGGRTEQLTLPDADEQILSGVTWGSASAFFTPAYWATQYWYSSLTGWDTRHQWGTTLKEEIVACLLGGYGITYELNRAAFERLKQRGCLDDVEVSEDEIVKVLSEPMEVDNRRVRYRFPNQKGRFVSGSLRILRSEEAPVDCGEKLREWLLRFPGIGIKTASWISRNTISGYRCAVIDVHLLRAGVIMGLFSRAAKLPTQYRELEARFLLFCSAIGADPTKLDVLIWSGMREAGQIGIDHYQRTESVCN